MSFLTIYSSVPLMRNFSKKIVELQREFIIILINLSVQVLLKNVFKFLNEALSGSKLSSTIQCLIIVDRSMTKRL